MKKKSNLKIFLATASAFAMITGASSTAMGAQKNTANGGGINSFNTAVHWGDGAIVGDGDHIQLQANGDIVNMDIENIHITQIDLNGKNSGGYTVNANGIKLGNVTNGGNAAALTFEGAHDIALVGGDQAGRNNASNYDKIAGVNFANFVATLNIDTDMNLGGAGLGDAIDLAGAAQNAGNATLNVKTDLNVADESWGTIKTINIGTAAAAKIFKIESNAANIVLNNAANDRINLLHNDSVLHLENTGGAHNVIINHGYLGGETDGNGKIIVKSNGNAMNVDIANGATIGKSANSRLGTLTFNGDNASTVNALVFAKNIEFGITANGKNLVFAKDVTGGNNSTFKYTHANAQEVEFRGNTQITDIDFDNKAGTIKVSDGKILTANIYGDQGAANIKGTLELLGDTGFIGTASKLELISAGNNNKKATISAGDHTVNEVQTLHANGTISFADGANILSTGAANSGSLDRTGGAAGKLEFLGNSIIEGSIGANAPVALINVIGGSDKVIQFKAATTAANLNIGKAGQDGAAKVKIGNNLTADLSFVDDVSKKGELEIYGAAAHTITGNINKAIADESRGKIIIANDVGANAVTFKGQIGDTANKKAINHLHILNNNVGSSVVLEGGDVHIEKIQAVGAGSLKLNAPNGKYKFGEIVVDADNVFALEVDQNVVLKAPVADSVNFGSSAIGGRRLSELKFNADKTLTIENGVNIYAAELNKTGVNNNGTLIFEGDSILSADSATQNIKAIEIRGNGNTVKLSKATKTHQDIKLANNATLEVAGNITTDIAANGANHGLIGAANENGHLKFVNSGAVTVTGNVGGAANALQSIEFNNGNVQFKSAVIHTGKDFKFTGQNESVVTFDKAGFGDANFVNASNADNIKHTVVLSKDEIFTGRLAVDNPATKQIAFDIGTNDTKATLRGGVQANGASFVNKGVSGRGTLELNEANLTIYSAGTNTKKLKTIELQEDATITNGAYADTITIKQDTIAVIGGEVSGNNFNLANVGSTVKFLDGGTLKVAVTATTANQGMVEFQGGGVVETGKSIGTLANRVKTVTFSDDATKTLTFGSSVFASEKIDIGEGIFKTENNNVILNAPDVNTKNASFDLGSSGKITVNGGNLTFSGEGGKIAVIVAQSGNSNGQIIAGTGSTLKYEEGSKVTITPDDSGSSNRLVAGETNEFSIIKNDTGRDVIGTLNVAFDESKNSFTKWSSRFENGTLILTQKDAAADKIKEILEKRLDTADKGNIDALTQAERNTDAYNFVNILQDIARNQDGKLSYSEVQEKVDEAYKRLISTTAATDSIENTMNNAAHSIGTRLGSVSNQPIGTPVQSRAVASAKVTGVAAGDDSARYGAWFSPFFGKTTQKSRKGSSGYRDSTYGGSFGMDTKANDDLIIGGAMTFANSETKYKNLKSGDRTKVNSLMFSIYALQQITDTWFAQGSATVGSNEVKNLNKRVPNASAYQLASSKYNAMSFVGDLLFGYNYAVEGFKLTPMGGVRYTRVNSAGYKETGTTAQNLDVSQKASNKLEVVVGAKVSGGIFEINGMSVTPEVRGFINHDIIGKTPKQDLHIGGVSNALNTKSIKPVNTSYNLGVGITANYGMMEYGAGYDIHLADKRVGHEGSLKVRVNF